MVMECDDRNGVTTRNLAGASTSSQGAVEVTQGAGTASGQADVVSMLASLKLMMEQQMERQAERQAEWARKQAEQAERDAERARKQAEREAEWARKQAERDAERARKQAEQSEWARKPEERQLECWRSLRKNVVAAIEQEFAVFNERIRPNRTDRVAEEDGVVGRENDVVWEMEDIAGAVVDVVGEKDVIVAEVDDVVGEADDVVGEEDNVVVVTVTDQLREEIIDSESSNGVSVPIIPASEEKPEMPQCDGCSSWAGEEQEDHAQLKEREHRGDRKRQHLAIKAAILVRRAYQTQTDSGMLKAKIGHLRIRCLKPNQPRKDLRENFGRRLMARYYRYGRRLGEGTMAWLYHPVRRRRRLQLFSGDHIRRLARYADFWIESCSGRA